MLVEEQYVGNDYRVLVVNGSMVAASLRRPAEVVGDGARTVGELIDEVNRDPRRGEGHSKPLSRVDAEDAAVLAELDDQGLTLAAVPEEGRVVRLTQGANLSTGGSAADVTDVVHPQVRALCERAARVIGLDICGIDLILPDISQPVPKRGGGIVEVNAGPGLRMHQFPSEGQPRDVGAAIVDMLFPGGSDGRIPIVAVTGTNGKTTVTRMIAHALASTGKTVGMTTTSGIHVGVREVAHGDMTGPLSAQAILCDPAVEVAVLETARGGIVRGGLGYDWSDVAVMTNVQLDHVGQDGIEDLDDILHIKSLVVERVRDGGTVVLNADDPLVLSLAERPDLARRGCRVVLFSLEASSDSGAQPRRGRRNGVRRARRRDRRALRQALDAAGPHRRDPDHLRRHGLVQRRQRAGRRGGVPRAGRFGRAAARFVRQLLRERAQRGAPERLRRQRRQAGHRLWPQSSRLRGAWANRCGSGAAVA